ncbi:MAG: glycosyltransferase [Bacteroidota bacterium]
MKLLLAIDNLNRGGRERRMLELVKGLLGTGSFQITLIVFSDRLHYKHVHDLDIDLHILVRKPKKDPRVFRKFYKICKNFQPDLIHTWGDMSTIYAIPSAFFLGIKLVNGSVVDAPKDAGWRREEYSRKRIALPFCEKVVGNSQAGLDAYEIPRDKAVCIYNGFDFNRLNELREVEDVRADFKVTAKHVVGMVGAFFDRKDYKTYVAAAKIVLDAGHDVAFLCVGGGQNKQAVFDSIEEKYRKNIIFTGSQEDVESIIHIFDIGVLATNSDIHGEGISNAILEYMAQGKPVVATLGGGTPEIVLDGKTGFTVKPKSPQEMAERIMHLLNHPELAHDMGEKSRERIKNHFNLAHMTAVYMDLYNSVLNRVNDFNTHQLAD